MKSLNTYINEWRANSNTVQDIEKSDIQYFTYRTKINDKIKIFNKDWPQFKEYKNKVYINDEIVELYDSGYAGFTRKHYEPGIYKIKIKDINDVTDCRYMFYGCKQLISVPLFDTSKVEDMIQMFYNCEQLISVPLFNTTNVKVMHTMFAFCTNIKEVPLFNTKNVENMNNMFINCYNIEDVPLFDTNKVKNMSNMFYKCHKLSERTKQEWSRIYDFKKQNKIK